MINTIFIEMPVSAEMKFWSNCLVIAVPGEILVTHGGEVNLLSDHLNFAEQHLQSPTRNLQQPSDQCL